MPVTGLSNTALSRFNKLLKAGVSYRSALAIADRPGEGYVMNVIGSRTTPLASAGAARPDVAGPVYWMCAVGITPSNALSGDLIWNAS